MTGDTRSFPTLELINSGAALRSGTLDPQHLVVLPDHAGADGRFAMLLRTVDLDALLRSVPKDVVLDRGIKHDSRPLSVYIPRCGGLVAIRTRYRDAGQAMRGIRALLGAVERQNGPVAFFIGVTNAIFDALAARAEPVSQLGDSAEDSSAQLRILIGDSIAVPNALREAYLGNAPQIDWVRRCIVMATRIKDPVLIQGESGTGKEVVARQIHFLSHRRIEGFVPVNCGGIPSELFESELFGHVKGSFTSATHEKSGLWTIAHDGTLLLDEIGDLSPLHQVKVLRALDEGCFRAVGGVKEIRSRARVIAATNRDLAAMVQTGQFREDLYYRLFNFRIRTPALREHPDDIPLLAQHFWHKIRDGVGHALPVAVTDALANFRWPGNARELRSFLVNLSLVADSRKVDVPLVRAVMRERLGGVSRGGRDF